MRRVWSLATVGAVIIVGLVVAWHYVGQIGNGQINVTTNNSTAQIAIILTDKSRHLGTGHANSSLKPGSYRIEASTDSSAARATITITKGATTSLNFSLSAVHTPTMVVSNSAQNLLVSGPIIKFLNTSLNQAYQFNSTTTASGPIANLYPIKQLFWQSPTTGIAINDIGDPYLLDGSTTHPLAAVTTNCSTPAIQGFDTNSVGDFVYSQCGNVYRWLQSTKRFTTIAQTTASIVQNQVAANGTVFVNAIRPINANTTIIDIGTPTKSQVSFIALDGHPSIYPDATTITAAAWSPNSTDIALSTAKGLIIYNFVTAKTTVVSPVAISSSASFNWIDPTHLIYVDAGSIWSFNSSSTISAKLAVTPGNFKHPTPFTLSDNQLYFSTDPTDALGSAAAIYKLNL